MARKPSTTITAIAQCGNPESPTSDCTLPEPAVDDDDGVCVLATDAADSAEAEDAAAAAVEADDAAANDEEITESAKVVSGFQNEFMTRSIKIKWCTYGQR